MKSWICRERKFCQKAEMAVIRRPTDYAHQTLQIKKKKIQNNRNMYDQTTAITLLEPTNHNQLQARRQSINVHKFSFLITKRTKYQTILYGFVNYKMLINFKATVQKVAYKL